MDAQQQRQVYQAAEKFAEALAESYRALMGRLPGDPRPGPPPPKPEDPPPPKPEELNAQLTQDFFNGVINNLRTQAENNRALSEDLIEQQRKQQEASQALAQESVNAYTDFLNSMFAYYKGNLDELQRRANQ